MAPHRVVLAAASTHLRALLGRWRHPHPLLIFHNIKGSELRAIVDFIYTGKVTVAEASLASFLKVAEKLQVKGLVGEREDVGTTTAHRPLPCPTISEGAGEEKQEVALPKRCKGRPRKAAKVVKAVRRSMGMGPSRMVWGCLGATEYWEPRTGAYQFPGILGNWQKPDAPGSLCFPDGRVLV